MNTLEIQECLHKIRPSLKHNVYAPISYLFIQKRLVFLVSNLDVDPQPASHWVAIHIDNNKVGQYFHQRWTWRSSDGNTKNELDYILTNINKNVQNVEVLNIPYPSDHRCRKENLPAIQPEEEISEYINYKFLVPSTSANSLITKKTGVLLEETKPCNAKKKIQYKSDDSSEQDDNYSLRHTSEDECFIPSESESNEDNEESV
ncbi:unnamed protein product, partial [Brenthis ino]